MQAILDDAAKRYSIDVDSSCTLCVVVAELRGCRASKRVSHDTNLLQVELALESPGGVIRVQLPQPPKDEPEILNPDSHRLSRGFLRYRVGHPVKIALAVSDCHATIRKGSNDCPVGSIEAHHDIAVTGKVLGNRCVIRT